jgi:CHASE2 domain-containing sensor protein
VFDNIKSRLGVVVSWVAALSTVVKRWAVGKGRGYWWRFARHWGVAVILIYVGMHVGGWLGDQQYWIDLRYRIYERQTHNIAHPSYDRRTVIVMIGDEEHWLGEGLAGRSPTKRSYLARLLRAVGVFGPEVVALDIRLRSPRPDGAPVTYHDYDVETQELIQAINDITSGPTPTTVALPKSIGGNEARGYFLESDLYDGKLDLNGGRVCAGYIAFDDDRRKVPLDLNLKDGGKLDSFALAIVRAAEGTPPLPSHDNNSMPYGSFMWPDQFKQYTASRILHSAEVVQAARQRGLPLSAISADDKEVLDNLAHKIVIIGGNWHGYAYNRGPMVDSFNTPVGEISGAFVHANYINSLMSSGITAPLDEKMTKGIDVLFSLAVATLFFLPFRTIWKLLAFFSLAVVLVFVSYFFWQNLGLYFDFFIPMALLCAHFLVEHFLRVREEAVELRARVKELSAARPTVAA